MGNDKKNALLAEQLREFKYRANYRISETPKYRPLVGNDEEFDDVPELTNEAGEQEDAQKPMGQKPPAPSNDQPIDMGGEPPVPAFDAMGDAPVDPNAPPQPPMDGGMPPEPPMGGDSMGAPIDPMAEPPAPENQVDDIQNDIIKNNIEAMKAISDQLNGFNSNIEELNLKMARLNADVEEVREPTNSEKLQQRAKVSYPYYFNLNDFWEGNWMEQRNAELGNENSKGMKKLPDGTFVADFDDLPQKSKIDVQDSFNDI